ncbi:MAG TPA: sulfotransferase family 2 domain-containing protein [Caulobacteraceae bacterium]|jgi:hypothetical protein
MPFADLRDQPLNAFLEAERDEEALWLFMHVPKTAGSSLSNELARARKPYRNIHIDYSKPQIPHDQQLQAAVDDFIASAQARPHRSASGHITMKHARQIKAAIPSTKLVTVIRDPVARVISDFRYQRTPAHPPHQDFIRRFPTIWDFIEHGPSRNKIARHLAPDFRAPAEQIVRDVAAAMAFIGAVEMYPLSFSLMFKLMGQERRPKLHVRKTEARPENDVEVTPALRQRISELNQIDEAIYGYVVTTLKRRRKEWVAERRERQATAGAAA